ncbi:polymorphic toxin type 5 domain-containing protein [Microbispora sp. GKU 823]|uniref:polymorphic toxin type 5 domain-containing protein n=1 Tax=Microbispora sp. GKU 823 TaxID=1652100 RepID=UPI0015C41BED|nr:polymorphic toxin type 5 domain-containing protein [Microbispora sp. GKU 823]
MPTASDQSVLNLAFSLDVPTSSYGSNMADASKENPPAKDSVIIRASEVGDQGKLITVENGEQVSIRSADMGDGTRTITISIFSHPEQEIQIRVSTDLKDSAHISITVTPDANGGGTVQISHPQDIGVGITPSGGWNSVENVTPPLAGAGSGPPVPGSPGQGHQQKPPQQTSGKQEPPQHAPGNAAPASPSPVGAPKPSAENQPGAEAKDNRTDVQIKSPGQHPANADRTQKPPGQQEPAKPPEQRAPEQPPLVRVRVDQEGMSEDYRRALNRELMKAGLNPMQRGDWKPTEFDRQADHNKAFKPIYDKNTGDLIGYRYQSQGFWRIHDRDGNVVGSGEKPLEEPPVDPIDFVTFDGGFVEKVGEKLTRFAAKAAAKDMGKVVAKEAATVAEEKLGAAAAERAAEGARKEMAAGLREGITPPPPGGRQSGPTKAAVEGAGKALEKAERQVVKASTLPEYSSKRSFMSAMRKRLLELRKSGRPSRLDFLLDSEGNWQKGSLTAKSGRTYRGRYAMVDEAEPQIVQAGHLQSETYAKAVGKREYLMLEDADLNVEISGRMIEGKGAYASKPAVLIDDIPVDVPTAELYESHGLLPAGTVHSAVLVEPPEF